MFLDGYWYVSYLAHLDMVTKLAGNNNYIDSIDFICISLCFSYLSIGTITDNR